MQTALLSCQRAIHQLCKVAVNLQNDDQTRWRALGAILKIIGTAFGIKFEPFQYYRIWRFISDIPHFFEVSCRGGSKTQDFLIAAFILCEGEYTQCAWLAGNNPQLEEAIKKSKPLILLFNAEEGTTPKSHDPCINFSNGSCIEFNPMTATSGGRKNLIVLDEGGKITDKDKKENYRFAVGMNVGTFNDLSEDSIIQRLQGAVLAGSGIKRIRHCSTLAYDTPAEEFYKALEPLGLVFITTVDQVWWVKKQYETDPVFKSFPRWFIRMEYWCELMPKGQQIFEVSPTIVRGFDIAAMMAMYHDGLILIGGDHNPAWGHAFVAVFRQRGRYTVFDELRTQPPANSAMAIAWLNKYVKRWPGRVYLKFESPGSIVNIVDDIRGAGITIHDFETWDGKMQTLKVSVYQGLLEHGLITYTDNVTNVINQHPRYAFDEQGKIPRQEDHMLDCISHVIESEVSAFTIDQPAGTVEDL